MKKKILAIAFIAIGFGANAQQEVKFGPKAGVNFATLSNTEGSKILTGFNVGAVAEIKFNDKFSVQPELMYSAQGVKADVVKMGFRLQGTRKLDYINIPILAKYYVYKGLSVEAGPQFAFLVKNESSGDGSGGSIVSGGTYYHDDVRSFEFGIGAGLAYDLENGFFVNARYNFGLTDVFKHKSSKSVNNGVIQIGVGYKF